MRLVGWCAFGVVLTASSLSLAEPQFEAVDGYVVMEAESAPLVDRLILVHEDADEGAAKEAPETLYLAPPGTGGAGGTDPTGGAGAGPGAGSGGDDVPGTGGSGGTMGDDGNDLDGGAEDEGGCTMSRAPANDAPDGLLLFAVLGAAGMVRRRRRR